MSTRREVITLLGGAVVARPLAARAQSLPNHPEVGFLYTGSASALPSRITAFSDGLRSRGYVEGHNVSVITRTAEWRPDQYETLIYRRTGNLRAVQLLLGHTKIESTVRYLGVEVDDALAIAEQVDV